MHSLLKYCSLKVERFEKPNFLEKLFKVFD